MKRLEIEICSILTPEHILGIYKYLNTVQILTDIGWLGSLKYTNPFHPPPPPKRELTFVASISIQERLNSKKKENELPPNKCFFFKRRHK